MLPVRTEQVETWHQNSANPKVGALSELENSAEKNDLVVMDGEDINATSSFQTRSISLSTASADAREPYQRKGTGI